MTLEYRVGDVFDRLREIPDESIDLIVTSPPFLALRSYLPADHPDKGREIGSEATPAEFIDTLLALSAEWGRVLAPHGSLCVELGDTFSGSGSGANHLYDTGYSGGTHGFNTKKPVGANGRASMVDKAPGGHHRGDSGWPLPKSLTGIPTLYPWSLAYGRNLLTGQPSPAGQWRIRNLIVWARPNPPVGALGDKFRPATSYITVACKSAKRYFDLDAVRTEGSPNTHARLAQGTLERATTGKKADNPNNNFGTMREVETAGAPPLDWHTDNLDGDWLWRLPTQPYAGSHYACFPMALPKRLIEAMCPLRVCTVCGKPSERLTGEPEYVSTNGGRVVNQWAGDRRGDAVNQWTVEGGNPGHAVRSAPTLGWSDCGCCPFGCHLDDWENPGEHDLRCDRPNKWRTGNVLDPFAGSGTTLEAAQAVGRHAIGIDLDSRNADLARQRVGMFLTIDGDAA